MSEIDWVVVPSRWWENSPLVIQEAFMHGRPVICSGIGGMAEKVDAQRERAALHRQQPGQPGGDDPACDEHARALGAAARRDPPRSTAMDEHIANLTRSYDELIDRRSFAAELPWRSTGGAA